MKDQCVLMDQMIEHDLNTPYTSSVGRLFDAASALLGVCPQPTYEGQPAMELEAAMELAGADAVGFAPDERYAVQVVKNVATERSTAHDTSVVLLDAAGTFAALLDDMAAGVAVPVIAHRFHDAFVQACETAALVVQQVYGITTVALGGGVFMNRYLVEQAADRLAGAGFTVALNRELPPNDGCIAFGQAVAAAARS